LTTEFDSRFLAQTLEYATATVPFYRNFRNSHNASRELLLSDFPLIDKTTVARDFDQFLNLDRFPDFVISSGGTMSNSGTFSYRCQEEYEAVHYYSSGKDPREPFEADPSGGFALDIFNNSNGYYWRKAPGWPVLAVTLEQQAHADLIARLLRDGLTVKGQQMSVKHVQGQCGPMRALTGYYHSTDVAPAVHSAPSLLVYGSHTTRIWKRRFLDVWGVAPLELYGLSEFAPGTALKCDHCGGFHFWTCWAEFLALDSDNPVVGGDARLVLTSLVPFVRLQPRIRYLTGDIVTITGLCSKTGRVGFRFRGRTASSVILRGGSVPSVLFSECEVLEVVEQLPDVSHQVHVSERQIWETANVPKPNYPMGYPRVRVAVDRDRGGPVIANITIEVGFAWESDLTRSSRFLDRFHELLGEEVPRLDSALSDGSLKLNVGLADDRRLNLWIKSSA
jgi:hypothetical protein